MHYSKSFQIQFAPLLSSKNHCHFDLIGAWTSAKQLPLQRDGARGCCCSPLPSWSRIVKGDDCNWLGGFRLGAECWLTCLLASLALALLTLPTTMSRTRKLPPTQLLQIIHMIIQLGHPQFRKRPETKLSAGPHGAPSRSCPARDVRRSASAPHSTRRWQKPSCRSPATRGPRLVSPVRLAL